MIIGIDLDSTLVDTVGMIKDIFIKHQVAYTPALDWHMTNYPEEIRKEIFDIFKNKPEIMRSIKPFPGVISLLDRMSEKNEIIIITSRVEIEENKRWIESMFPMVSWVIVTNSENKKEHFINEKIDIWIDDAPHGIEDARSLGIPTIMISNSDTPYNHHMRRISFYIPNIMTLDFLGNLT